MIARLTMLWILFVALAATGCCTPLFDGGDADGMPDAIRIEGNKALSDRELADAAELEIEAFTEKGHREADADDAAWSMERHLHSRGYFKASVEHKIEGQTAVFHIEEGHRALLNAVHLCGVKSLDREDLMEYFAFEGEQLLGLGPVIYDEQRLRDAAEQIEREYRLNGFQDVEISEPKTKWDDKHSCAVVTFTVIENKRTCVCSVRFEGVCPCDLGLKGKPFTSRMPAQAAGRVRSGLLARGHQFAEVRGEAKRRKGDCAGGTRCADIVVKAVPGPQVRLGCIHVKRLDRTSPVFIRGIIPLQRGQILKQGSIDKGIENLYRSGLFSGVTADVVQTGPDTADLTFELPEVLARSVELEVGYGSYERLRAGVKYLDRNLFGWGRRLEAYGRGHMKGVETEVSVIDPWIFGSRYELEISGLFERRREPSYTFTGIQARAAVTAILDDDWWLRGGYRFQREKATDVQGEIPGAERDGFINAAGFFLDAVWDTRDSVLLPTSGTVVEAGTFWSSPGLGADLDYVEITGRITHLMSFGDVVLALGASFRTKTILTGGDTLPIQERYFLGGESTVRSFEESELGPVDEQGDPIGGLTALTVHGELRFPIINALHGAVFYDGGVVSPDSFDIKEEYGHAIGAGIRYYFPFGPLRLDAAYNPGALFGASDRITLHVSLGFSF